MKKLNKKNKSNKNYIDDEVDIVSDFENNALHEEQNHESKDKLSTTKQKLKNSKLKHYLRYSVALINESYDNDNSPWESEEKARLLILMKNTLQLDNDSLRQLVIDCNFISPMELVALQELGLSFSPSQYIQFLKQHNAQNAQDLIKTFENALDADLLNLDDEETLAALSELIEENAHNPNHYQFSVHFSRTLCSYAESFRRCGKILHALTSSMLAQAASILILEVLSYDFVYDLKGLSYNHHFIVSHVNSKGKLKHLFRELHEISDDLLKIPLERMFHTNRRGEIKESDEDDDGNLLGFVDNDYEDDNDDSGDDDNSSNSSNKNNSVSDSEELNSSSTDDELVKYRVSNHKKRSRRIIEDESDD